jgi:hypothetical protein
MTYINRVIFILAAFIMNACLCEEEAMLAGSDKNPIYVYVKDKSGWSGSDNIVAGSGSKYKIQAQFPKIGQYTVQFGIGDLPPVTGDGQYKAQAEIIWSVKGNSVRRLVNCADGMSVSGTAEAVSITITDASNLDGAPSFRYVVSAQIAPGTRPSVQQPPVLETAARQLVDIGSSLQVLVPKDAGVISVYTAVAGSSQGFSAVAPLEAGSIRVGQLAGSASLKFYDPRDFQWVPLSPGTDKLLYTVAPGASQAVYFSTVWGIDG